MLSGCEYDLATHFNYILDRCIILWPQIHPSLTAEDLVGKRT